MSALVRQSPSSDVAPGRHVAIAAGSAVIVLAAFFFAPGSIAQKSHAALHGLCAQRPSHSFWFGAETLPLDARMTGIYLGAATTIFWQLARGRFRAVAPMPRAVVALLGLFVAVMALDGGNGLLVDLGLPHPYEPSNAARLLTGILAGTSLGVASGYLFAISMWRRADGRQAAVGGLRGLCVPIGTAVGLGALAGSGLPILYAPFAIGLLLAATGVFWLLAIVVVALLAGRGWSHATYGDLLPLAAAALFAAVVVMLLLGAARFATEAWLGLPKLT